MTLRCKPGDLAVIVRATNAPQHIGKIVRAVRLSYSHKGPAWEINPTFGTYHRCLDANLCPIRDQEGDDETLTWAGVPDKETA